MRLLLSLGVSLAVTLTIELCVACLCRLRGRELLLVVLVNCLTNPLVVLLCWLVRAGTALPRFAAELPLEVLVVLAEGALYRQKSTMRHPWRFSLTANAVSYLSGVLLWVIPMIMRR